MSVVGFQYLVVDW